MCHRQPCGFDDGLHVLQRLPRLPLDGVRQFAIGVASALTGDVEKIAGDDSGAVRTDWFDPGRRDGAFLRARTGRIEENDDGADEKETDAHHGRPFHRRIIDRP